MILHAYWFKFTFRSRFGIQMIGPRPRGLNNLYGFIYGAVRLNRGFVDLLTFPLAPYLGQNVHFYVGDRKRRQKQDILNIFMLTKDEPFWTAHQFSSRKPSCQNVNLGTL